MGRRFESCRAHQILSTGEHSRMQRLSFPVETLNLAVLIALSFLSTSILKTTLWGSDRDAAALASGPNRRDRGLPHVTSEARSGIDMCDGNVTGSEAKKFDDSDQGHSSADYLVNCFRGYLTGKHCYR